MTTQIDKIMKERAEIAALPVPNFPTGNYSIIVADPPWSYHLRDKDITHRGRTPYPTMSPHEILSLPVASIAKLPSYLFLWTTKDHLRLALDCVTVWGFQERNVIPWIKTTNDRSKVYPGLGHWMRNCSEFLILATKGKAKTFTSLGLTDTPAVIHAPRGKHSQKPEELAIVVDRLAAALGEDTKIIELFARSQRKGWASWGYEIKEENIDNA